MYICNYQLSDFFYQLSDFFYQLSDFFYQLSDTKKYNIIPFLNSFYSKM
jgi:hypothetical protein